MSKPAIDARPEVGGMKLERIRIVVLLPGAVRPEKPHDLAFADLEIQVLNRGLAGVAFGEVFDFDHEAVMLSDN